LIVGALAEASEAAKGHVDGLCHLLMQGSRSDRGDYAQMDEICAWVRSGGFAEAEGTERGKRVALRRAKMKGASIN
jgi:hypothetical protein